VDAVKAGAAVVVVVVAAAGRRKPILLSSDRVVFLLLLLPPVVRPSSTSSSVGEPGGKRVTVRILDVANVKGAGMTLAVHDGADATRVACCSLQ
jgi:hypothetical protein